MLIRRSFAVLGAIALAAIAPACAGGSETVPPGSGGAGGKATTTSTTSSATTSDTGTGGTGTGGSGGSMPMNGCKPSSDTVFAVDRLYFGDADWNDAAGPNAWQNFGLDADLVTSTGTATGVCTPVSGANVANVHTDGPSGLDNNFGKLVLPVFLQSIPNLSAQANGALINGDFTILIRMGGLGAAADQSGIPGAVYSGAYLPDVPKFDGTDCWPVQPESLTDTADIESAKCKFPASKLTGNQWDSVDKGEFNLTLQIFNFQGQITIHKARIVMDLDANHAGTQRGIISGVLDTEEFVTAIDRLMSEFDPANCSGSTPLVTNINKAIRQSSDIMKDGTQNPAATCDGITIGLGFKAVKVEFGSIGMPLTPTPDPCMP